MSTVLIIGASRGIGLGCVQYFLEQGDSVIATVRDVAKAAELQALQQQHNLLEIKSLDILDESSIIALSKSMQRPIDLLIINAGVGSAGRTLADTSVDDMLYCFKTNALGHFLIAKHFSENLAKGEQKQLVSLSSRMGSIGDNSSGKAYAYRASKAADNAIMRSVAIDLAPVGIHVIIYHPGWVKTDMTKGVGELSVVDAVGRLANILENRDQYESGSFVSHNKSILPW